MPSQATQQPPIGQINAPRYSPEMSAIKPLSPADITPVVSNNASNGGSLTSSPPSSASFPLRIKNLPRDITRREFRLIFAFAKDFLSCDLAPSEDYVSGPVTFGVAYFKSYAAAVEAHDTLHDRPDLFDARDSLPANGSTSSSASSPNYTPRPLICDFPSGLSLSSSFDHYHHPSISAQSSSHSLPFASPSTANSFKNSNTFPTMNMTTNSQQQFHGAPQSAAPKGLSRFHFPAFEQLSPTTPATVPPSSEAEFFHQQPDLMFSGSSTSPRGTFSPGTGELPRISGKSVLLESAGRDDEEYEDMVKDPVAWFSKGSQMPAGGIPPQPLSQSQQQQPAGQSQASAQPQAWPQQQPSQADRTRRNTSTTSVPTRQFGTMSLSNQGGPASQASFPPGAVATPTSALAPPSAPGPAGSQASGQQSSATSLHALQNGGRVLPPANPADQNPPCNTLYVGNLPMNTSEDELKALFSRQRGYKRLCFRTKMNGPMCFVEFEDVAYATRALTELYGRGLSNSVKGGIRLSFSKNPLGVRSNGGGGSNNSSNGHQSNGQTNGSGASNMHPLSPAALGPMGMMTANMGIPPMQGLPPPVGHPSQGQQQQHQLQPVAPLQHLQSQSQSQPQQFIGQNNAMDMGVSLGNGA
ncbi:uncharacterized protein V2V93DRAFT_327860 [Kockiozyma suomiensis]|uniref:uncharacterized protein n=1 Tax=Kockiozyma suomiensis TaxID=1337062 RepID=UPI0033430274